MTVWLVLGRTRSCIIEGVGMSTTPYEVEPPQGAFAMDGNLAGVCWTCPPAVSALSDHGKHRRQRSAPVQAD